MYMLTINCTTIIITITIIIITTTIILITMIIITTTIINNNINNNNNNNNNNNINDNSKLSYTCVLGAHPRRRWDYKVQCRHRNVHRFQRFHTSVSEKIVYIPETEDGSNLKGSTFVFFQPDHLYEIVLRNVFNLLFWSHLNRQHYYLYRMVVVAKRVMELEVRKTIRQ